MKNKILPLCSALALLAAAGCQKENDTAEVVLPADVQVSSTQAVLPVAGGSVTVLVSANYDWSYANEGDWMDITRSGDRLVISTDENRSPYSRTALVVVTAQEDETNFDRALIKVVQPAWDVTDLSSGSTANCYIATPGGSYSFNANVKGNGKTDGNSYYFRTQDVDIPDAAIAILLWEATFDGDRTRSSHIIEGSPVYSKAEKRIYFNTGSAEGNAVIAAAKADGTILWSWHIWVTAAPVSAQSAVNGYQLMDRNLGAMNNTPGDIANRGLLYQWGRKDPFLPSRAEYMTDSEPGYLYNDETPDDEKQAIIDRANELEELANVANDQVGDGEGRWSTMTTPIELKAPGNLPYAISHPMTYFSAASGILGNYVFDWYLVRDIDTANDVYMQSFSDLWGQNFTERPMRGEEVHAGYKTIFDPCPPGWAVPCDGVFNTQEKIAGSTVELTLSYKEDDSDPDRWHKSGYGWIWDEGNGQYFPSAGYRFHNTSGPLRRTGSNMLYWTNRQVGNFLGKSAALFVDGFIYNGDPTRQLVPFLCYGIVYDGGSFTDYYNTGSRLYAGSVRCMREK